MVNRVLVVEDDPTFSIILKERIEREIRFDVMVAPTHQTAMTHLKRTPDEYFVALVDLNLPDSKDGQIVKETTALGIPTIVFTGTLDEDILDRLWDHGIVDYVIKDRGHNVDYVLSLIRRINHNKKVKVLVVNDKDDERHEVVSLLAVHQYDIYEAKDGMEALLVLNEHPDMKMVITEYDIPKLDGLHLSREIRKKYRKEELAVIGLASKDNTKLSSRFIKYGANDFLIKPFSIEEFYCRTVQNVEFVEHLALIKEISNKDFLTELHNRRYFFDLGEGLFSNAQRQNLKVTIAMVDIDHFKSINDTYGHDFGDYVIKRIAKSIKKRFRKSDIVARFGGEEFCILATNMDINHTQKVFDELRDTISKATFEYHQQNVNVTVSIGICTELGSTLDAMIRTADEMLYQAKESGRNKVVIDQKPLENVA